MAPKKSGTRHAAARKAANRSNITKTAPRKPGAKSKYGPEASAYVEAEMKQGELKSGGSGKTVRNPKQAIAIGPLRGPEGRCEAPGKATQGCLTPEAACKNDRGPPGRGPRSNIELRYLLSLVLLVVLLDTLPVAPLLCALLFESPLEPVAGLLLPLSLEALALPLEPLSGLLEAGEALPFPLPPLALASLLAETVSEPPSDLADPFDPFLGPKESGAVWL
jgi:hypothetical protein